MEYKVIDVTSASELEKSLNEMGEKGWTPYYPQSHYTDSYNKPHFVMVFSRVKNIQ